MLLLRISSSTMFVKWFCIVFIVLQGSQSQAQSLWSCNVPLCTSAPAANGCSGATTCYAFNTSSGSSICAPAPPCSLFDVCSTSGSGCPSSKSICVINACCSSPVCIPLALIDMCSVTVTTTTTAASSTCTSLPGAWVLSSYNLVTLGNLSTSSDVENRTIVCGSLISSSSANFAIHVTSSTNTSSNYNLEVNGQIVSGNPINVNAGSFGVGTNPSHTITVNGVVNYLLDGRQVNMNGGNQGATVNVDANLTAKCAAIITGIQTLSSILAQLPNVTDNNVTIPTSQSGPLNFYVNAVDNNGVAVFNLDGNTVLNNGLVQQIQLTVGSSVSNTLQLVVINLSGTSITFGQGNFVGTWFTSISTGRALTIWNLPQATSLTINSDWMGALLAPYAIVTTSVNIDGATAVLSLTTTAELHDPPIIIPACL